MQLKDQSRPDLPLVTAYGRGGFSIAERRVEGAVLILPDRWIGVEVRSLEAVTQTTLSPLLSPSAAIDLLLVGGGDRLRPLPARLSRALEDAAIAIEPMDSGAAARTFNVLLLEERRVAALLMPL